MSFSCRGRPTSDSFPDEKGRAMSNRQPLTVSNQTSAAALLPVTPGLDELVAAVRGAVSRHSDWRQTAALVADQLRRHLPAPDLLTVEQRLGDPSHYCSHVLHIEPDGTFSIVALVWRPGQVTPIHDHVT
jgi:predicted metal-dependent enzyme (double-stranded beta helix superfamily)